jgi:hypothetical protein
VEPSPPLDMGFTGTRHPHHYWKENTVNIYITKDGNPFTISTRHVKANINTREKTKTIKTVVMKYKT